MQSRLLSCFPLPAGNYRSALTDATQARKLKPDHLKAIVRGKSSAQWPQSHLLLPQLCYPVPSLGCGHLQGWGTIGCTTLLMPWLQKCFTFSPSLLDLPAVCSSTQPHSATECIALEGTRINTDFITTALCKSSVPAPIPGA